MGNRAPNGIRSWQGSGIRTAEGSSGSFNTLVPYCGLWVLMVWSIQFGTYYSVTLLLALPAAAFLVRIFILFHDCVQGSFFRRKGANTFFGYLLGLLVFPPPLKTSVSVTYGIM